MVGEQSNQSSQDLDWQQAVQDSLEVTGGTGATRIKIAIIGDVHGAWDQDDEVALRHLGVDLVLLVGDFGNEAVELIQQIAAITLPKAVILGNHDAWYSASPWGIRQCPYDRKKEDRVQQQLDLLGASHIGYGKLDFPDLQLTVVGSRPFSWGGSEWKNADFYRARFGIGNFEESAGRIVEMAQQSAYETVIFLGHSGPKGLGECPEDPCGRDWHPLGGDYGDPDFTEAIAQARTLGKRIPLVAFGHMHHRLRHTKQHFRKAVVASPEGTVYVNAATVPRIIQTDEACLRNFFLVSLQGGSVAQVSSVWIDQALAIASEEIFYHASSQPTQLMKRSVLG